MGSAYTPGLTVSQDIVVRRTRRLPIKGEVLVRAGDQVTPKQTVARAELPGLLQTIKLAEKLGVEAKDVKNFIRVEVGNDLTKGDLVAESKGFFFGLGKQTITADYTGTVESISPISGHLLIRERPIPVEIDAFIQGKIVEVMENEGVIVETRGAMVQGIFGVGGERLGHVRVAVPNPHTELDAHHVLDSDAGKILVGGSCMTAAAIKRAGEVGAIGIVAGGVRDSDLIEYLGYDIGVAITGQEQVPVTLMVTEGFGTLHMAERTFELLKSLEGREASLNGATQIRAGVIRPELIVPLELSGSASTAQAGGQELKIGTPIRIIREPYFGELGSVTDLPAQIEVLESGTEVRVLRAKLNDGREVTVPRANVEIIAT